MNLRTLTCLLGYIVMSHFAGSDSPKVTYAPFIRKGKLFRVQAVVDLHIHVDLSMIRSSCLAVHGAIKNLSLSRHNQDPQFSFAVNRTILEVERFCAEPIFSLDPDALMQHHISKRQALLLGAGIGLLSSYVATQLFSSSSHSKQMEEHNFNVLDEEMRNLQHFVHSICLQVDAHEKATSAQIRILQFQSYLQTVLNHVRSISQGYVDLIQGTLSSNIIPVQKVKAEVDQLASLATSIGASLPFSDVLSLYVFPVKHSLGLKKVSFSISIPLINEEYENWKFLHAPIVVERSHEPIFISPQPRNSYLAVPTFGQPIVLSDNDLDHCTSWYDDYFCTYLPTRRDDDSCLVSLFLEPTEVMQNCDFSFPSFPSFVLTHLNEGQFLLSLNISSLSWEKKCADAAPQFGVFSRGQHLFSPGHNCSWTTRLFNIPAFTPVQKSVRVRPFVPKITTPLFDPRPLCPNSRYCSMCICSRFPPHSVQLGPIICPQC